MEAIISFDQGPALSVPLRFLLTAPVFGAAAGLFLAWVGPDVLASRWTPGALVLTHLITVGYMLQAMFGALLQFVPVAAGGSLWRPALLAGAVHPVITAGAVLLCASFADWQPAALRYAAVLLGSGCVGYGLAAGVALARSRASGVALPALRAAVLSLLATVALGVLLVEAIGGSLVLELVKTTDLHAAWGLGGWALLLLAGVSMYVVPMFQLTPPYPAWLCRALPAGVLGSLLALSILVALTDNAGWQELAVTTGTLLTTIFAAGTLWLQQRRRRRTTDATFLFFRSAMLCLLAACCVLAFVQAEPRADPAWQTRLGVLLLDGVFVSAINGMLYKIVPFLCALRLQRTGGSLRGRSGMLQLVSREAMNGQFWLHLVAVGLLLAATWLPELTATAGIAFASSCAWLEWNLAAATGRYRGLRDRIRAAAAAGGS